MFYSVSMPKSKKYTYVKVADRGLPMCNCGKSLPRLMTPDHIASKNHQSYLKSLEVLKWLSTPDSIKELTSTASQTQ